MPTPLVSVCLPSLNTRPFLEERMETILAQTVTDWELIICDSYSKDGSWEYFQLFRDDPRIELFQAPPLGSPGSWNYCLERSRGEYIYVATSDDTMAPECLERLLDPLQQDLSLGLAACDFDYIDENGRTIERDHRPMDFLGDHTGVPCVRHGEAEFLLHACFGPTWVTMTSTLFRSNLLETAGLFPAHLGAVGDTAWAMRAALVSDLAFVPGRWATWRIHENQASSPIVGRNAVGTMLRCISSVVKDPSLKVPFHWKKIPNWRREVTSVWAREYDHTFGLYRSRGRHDPVGFCRDCLAALAYAPGFLLRQTMSGFYPPDRSTFDRVENARRLLELFEAPWPPTPVL